MWNSLRMTVTTNNHKIFDSMKNNIIFKTLLLCTAASAAWSCMYDPYEHDIEKVEEKLEVSASSDAIVLLAESLKDDSITFEWTPAREMSEEYIVTYTTELDIVGDNFGDKTVIRNIEDADVFSRTFTFEQINNWASERWGVKVNQAFTLEFRVSASWEGGPTFEMPEVRVMRVGVTPVKIIVFDADKISISGNAIESEAEMSRTLENDNLYAWLGNLTPGELTIPVEFDGMRYYICPAGNGQLKDGEADEVTMEETSASWKITEAGEYRIVVDMQNKTVTIRSPKTALVNKSVTFRPNGVDSNPETTMEITELYAYGAGTGWGAKNIEVTQSLADPQILVYSGAALKGDMKFCISKSFTVDGVSYNQNNSYCLTCPLTAGGEKQTLSIQLNKVADLHGGADRATRDSYINIPENTNFIVFDLRNMTILAQNK